MLSAQEQLSVQNEDSNERNHDERCPHEVDDDVRHEVKPNEGHHNDPLVREDLESYEEDEADPGFGGDVQLGWQGKNREEQHDDHCIREGGCTKLTLRSSVSTIHLIFKRWVLFQS